ncbi:MAG TPA: hypothetical protein VF914_16110 [Chloroflexia bacterium]|jgi:hypothetical protein
MPQDTDPTDSPAAGQPPPQRKRGHQRRPPLAEVDTLELWEAWQRGDRRTVRPWLGLLASFCLVLAGMYSFFFFSIVLSDDPLGGAIISFVFIVLVFYLGRRISPQPKLVALVIGFMSVVSLSAFGLWLLASALSGWNAWTAITGTLVLGLLGAFLAVPSLNAIERQYARSDEG